MFRPVCAFRPICFFGVLSFYFVFLSFDLTAPNSEFSPLNFSLLSTSLSSPPLAAASQPSLTPAVSPTQPTIPVFLLLVSQSHPDLKFKVEGLKPDSACQPATPNLPHIDFHLNSCSLHPHTPQSRSYCYLLVTKLLGRKYFLSYHSAKQVRRVSSLFLFNLNHGIEFLTLNFGLGISFRIKKILKF